MLRVKNAKVSLRYLALTVNDNYFVMKIIKDKHVYLNQINKQKSLLRDKIINSIDV